MGYALRESELADIEGFLTAILEPHGCAVCGDTELYLGRRHVCYSGPALLEIGRLTVEVNVR